MSKTNNQTNANTTAGYGSNALNYTPHTYPTAKSDDSSAADFKTSGSESSAIIDRWSVYITPTAGYQNINTGEADFGMPLSSPAPSNSVSKSNNAFGADFEVSYPDFSLDDTNLKSLSIPLDNTVKEALTDTSKETSTNTITDDSTQSDDIVAINPSLNITISPGSNQSVDSEPIGLIIYPNPTGPLRINEDDSFELYIQLNKKPLQSVTFKVYAGTGLGIVDTQSDQVSFQEELTFNTDNWDQPQTLTLYASDDVVLNDVLTSLKFYQVTDDEFLDHQSIEVVIKNTDSAALVLTDKNLSITEGHSATIGLILSAQPDDQVTVTFEQPASTNTISETNNLNIYQSSLVFDANNWNIEQYFTISYPDDNSIDANENYTLRLSTSSVDPNFNDLTESISLQAYDNDQDQIQVTVDFATPDNNTTIANAFLEGESLGLDSVTLTINDGYLLGSFKPLIGFNYELTDLSSGEVLDSSVDRLVSADDFTNNTAQISSVLPIELNTLGADYKLDTSLNFHHRFDSVTENNIIAESGDRFFLNQSIAGGGFATDVPLYDFPNPSVLYEGRNVISANYIDSPFELTTHLGRVLEANYLDVYANTVTYSNAWSSFDLDFLDGVTVKEITRSDDNLLITGTLVNEDNDTYPVLFEFNTNDGSSESLIPTGITELVGFSPSKIVRIDDKNYVFGTSDNGEAVFVELGDQGPKITSLDYHGSVKHVKSIQHNGNHYWFISGQNQDEDLEFNVVNIDETIDITSLSTYVQDINSNFDRVNSKIEDIHVESENDDNIAIYLITTSDTYGTKSLEFHKHNYNTTDNTASSGWYTSTDGFHAIGLQWHETDSGLSTTGWYQLEPQEDPYIDPDASYGGWNFKPASPDADFQWLTLKFPEYKYTTRMTDMTTPGINTSELPLSSLFIDSQLISIANPYDIDPEIFEADMGYALVSDDGSHSTPSINFLFQDGADAFASENAPYVQLLSSGQGGLFAMVSDNEQTHLFEFSLPSQNINISQNYFGYGPQDELYPYGSPLALDIEVDDPSPGEYTGDRNTQMQLSGLIWEDGYGINDPRKQSIDLIIKDSDSPFSITFNEDGITVAPNGSNESDLTLRFLDFEGDIFHSETIESGFTDVIINNDISEFVDGFVMLTESYDSVWEGINVAYLGSDVAYDPLIQSDLLLSIDLVIVDQSVLGLDDVFISLVEQYSQGFQGMINVMGETTKILPNGYVVYDSPLTVDANHLQTIGQLSASHPATLQVEYNDVIDSNVSTLLDYHLNTRAWQFTEASSGWIANVVGDLTIDLGYGFHAYAADLPSDELANQMARDYIEDALNHMASTLQFNVDGVDEISFTSRTSGEFSIFSTFEDSTGYFEHNNVSLNPRHPDVSVYSFDTITTTFDTTEEVLGFYANQDRQEKVVFVETTDGFIDTRVLSDSGEEIISSSILADGTGNIIQITGPVRDGDTLFLAGLVENTEDQTYSIQLYEFDLTTNSMTQVTIKDDVSVNSWLNPDTGQTVLFSSVSISMNDTEINLLYNDGSDVLQQFFYGLDTDIITEKAISIQPDIHAQTQLTNGEPLIFNYNESGHDIVLMSLDGVEQHMVVFDDFTPIVSPDKLLATGDGFVLSGLNDFGMPTLVFSDNQGTEVSRVIKSDFSDAGGNGDVTLNLLDYNSDSKQVLVQVREFRSSDGDYQNSLFVLDADHNTGNLGNVIDRITFDPNGPDPMGALLVDGQIVILNPSGDILTIDFTPEFNPAALTNGQTIHFTTSDFPDYGSPDFFWESVFEMELQTNDGEYRAHVTGADWTREFVLNYDQLIVYDSGTNVYLQASILSNLIARAEDLNESFSVTAKELTITEFYELLSMLKNIDVVDGFRIENVIINSLDDLVTYNATNQIWQFTSDFDDIISYATDNQLGIIVEQENSRFEFAMDNNQSEITPESLVAKYLAASMNVDVNDVPTNETPHVFETNESGILSFTSSLFVDESQAPMEVTPSLDGATLSQTDPQFIIQEVAFSVDTLMLENQTIIITKSGTNGDQLDFSIIDQDNNQSSSFITVAGEVIRASKATMVSSELFIVALVNAGTIETPDYQLRLIKNDTTNNDPSYQLAFQALSISNGSAGFQIDPSWTYNLITSIDDLGNDTLHLIVSREEQVYEAGQLVAGQVFKVDIDLTDDNFVLYLDASLIFDDLISNYMTIDSETGVLIGYDGETSIDVLDVIHGEMTDIETTDPLISADLDSSVHVIQHPEHGNRVITIERFDTSSDIYLRIYDTDGILIGYNLTEFYNLDPNNVNQITLLESSINDDGSYSTYSLITEHDSNKTLPSTYHISEIRHSVDNPYPEEINRVKLDSDIDYFQASDGIWGIHIRDDSGNITVAEITINPTLSIDDLTSGNSVTLDYSTQNHPDYLSDFSWEAPLSLIVEFSNEELVNQPLSGMAFSTEIDLSINEALSYDDTTQTYVTTQFFTDLLATADQDGADLNFNMTDIISYDQYQALSGMGIDFQAVVIQVSDDPKVNEGGSITDTVAIRLASDPGSISVSVNLTTSDQTELTMIDSLSEEGDHRTVTFDHTNWDELQSVTLKGVPDSISDDQQISELLIAIDDQNQNPDFKGVDPLSIDVTTADNDGDPLLVDLNGDGYSGLDSVAPVSFDLNNDGFNEWLMWPGVGDALLAYDADNSGTIDSGYELVSPWLLDNRYADSFQALLSLDSNGDGIIDADDESFARLKLWLDDGDAIASDDELFSLGDFGIIGFDLATVQALESGNQDLSELITHQGELITDSGTIDFAVVQLPKADSIEELLANDALADNPMLTDHHADDFDTLTVIDDPTAVLT